MTTYISDEEPTAFNELSPLANGKVMSIVFTDDPGGRVELDSERLDRVSAPYDMDLIEPLGNEKPALARYC